VEVAGPVDTKEHVVPAGNVPAVVLSETVPVGAPDVVLPTTVAVHTSLLPEGEHATVVVLESAMSLVPIAS
jgi:hypothetical protein